ncbi:MAG TPA: methyltransferase domain-containing protein [Chthoniobacterales bacterium]|nr:methyltransferase domain-containing protein [Chthoniobacterales bacterium]
MPSPRTLLTLPALRNAKEKIGINLEGASELGDIRILQGNGNALEFPDERFDTVLCNATLEHDKFFWKTISEIRRVTRRGGLVVLGAPGYGRGGGEKWAKRVARNLPLVGSLLQKKYEHLFAATLTLNVHNFPGDYYRFSAQAFQEVFLADMHQIEVVELLMPPRIIGAATKP